MENRIKIFYAWQSDIDNKINRYFILDAIEDAIKRINKNDLKVPYPRLETDHDTKNVPGIPDITDTILKKIDECAIFIADLTFIAKSETKERYISNPNVVFELGYAIHSIGPKRIICIANEYFGHPEKLFSILLNEDGLYHICLNHQSILIKTLLNEN